METTYVVTWLPVFIIIFIIMRQNDAAKRVARLVMKRRKGRLAMNNELVKKYIGRYCQITTGSMGVSVSGRITEVNENWVEVETKKGNEIINLDFILNITIKG